MTQVAEERLKEKLAASVMWLDRTLYILTGLSQPPKTAGISVFDCVYVLVSQCGSVVKRGSVGGSRGSRELDNIRQMPEGGRNSDRGDWVVMAIATWSTICHFVTVFDPCQWRKLVNMYLLKQLFDCFYVKWTPPRFPTERKR